MDYARKSDESCGSGGKKNKSTIDRQHQDQGYHSRVELQPHTMGPNPLLYEINTRVLLTELSKTIGRPAKLDDIPDDCLNPLAEAGFEWVWLMGVWQTGSAGRKVALENAAWRKEFQELLPDFSERDVCGSPFAIQCYTAHNDFGGNGALAKLRKRLSERGIRLMLDFVPNHTALDHCWVEKNPDYYVYGSEEHLQREPQNYTRIAGPEAPIVLAYGRDPYFAGWPDTLQLNYANPAVEAAMAGELEKIAGMCDGVRCDMAMLLVPDIFEKTWGIRPEPFWPRAMERARAKNRRFVLMAEVYWGLEWALQQAGFDYTYDKTLYDRLRNRQARPVREHFRAEMEFQQKSVRFLENHDEPRAAGVFPAESYRAAAVLTYLSPGMRFFERGQGAGLRKRTPVHLARRPEDVADPEMRRFYDRLLRCLSHPQTREGNWELLECRPAWEGNWTADCFICFAWHGPNGNPILAVVNYAPNQSQCYAPMPFQQIAGKPVRLRDLMGTAEYQRQGGELVSRGLYLDLAPWGYHVFELTV